MENSIYLDDKALCLAISLLDRFAVELRQHDVFLDAVALTIENSFRSVDTLDRRKDLLLELADCRGLLIG